MPSPVYGNNGNRWWIGQNVGETGAMGNAFGGPSTPNWLANTTHIGNTPNGYESLPSGNAADDKQFAAAAAYNAIHTSKPKTISVENIEWYNIRGPYATQAKANAAIPGIQKSSPAEGALAQASANNVPGASAINSSTGFFSALGDANLWVRVAKVVAGGVILAIGLAKITGAGGIAAKAVKMAPLL